MARVHASSPTGENRLLATLPRADQERIRPRLEPVSAEVRDVLYRPNEPVEHLYFPGAGVFSLLIAVADGRTVEVGAVGSEGLIGMPAVLGAERSPVRVVCQLPGTVWRLPAAAYREEQRLGGALPAVSLRYAQALLNMVAQSTACNYLHPVDNRMARWLLMTRDRVGADEFPLTHEFLSQMLGVRRASVTVAAGVLQKDGLIRYRRDRLTVLDRQGLERAACECYRVVCDEFDRLLGEPGPCHRP